MNMLDGLQQQAIVVGAIKSLRSNQSWAGETHVQKSLYFLQNLMGVPLTYKFVLYKHGPYSFDLHNDIGKMRAYDFVELEPRPPYGSAFREGKVADKLLTMFDGTVTSYLPSIDFVAKFFGDSNVRELERYATALYVSSEEPNQPHYYLANKINELKPHIALEEATVAIQSVETLRQSARNQGLIED